MILLLQEKHKQTCTKIKPLKKLTDKKNLKQNSYLVAARASWGAMLPTAWIDQLLIV